MSKMKQTHSAQIAPSVVEKGGFGSQAPVISMADLEKMLMDKHLPSENLRPYIVADSYASQPFHPVLKIDLTKVKVDQTEEFRLAGAMSVNWANRVERWRRQTAFDLRRQNGEMLPVIVAEGDSWFEFPLIIDDLVDQLASRFLIWDVSASGDTLDNMIRRSPEYIQAVRRFDVPPSVMIFSGGGNDFLGVDPDGVPVLQKCLKRYEAGRPASWYLQTQSLAERFLFIEQSLRILLEKLESEFSGTVNVVLHGYDRAFPRLASEDPRRPFWTELGKWLYEPMKANGIIDEKLQKDIVGLLIDRFNEILQRLCGGNSAGGVYGHAFHADLRGVLSSVEMWADELHPSNEGFAKLAEKLAEVINDALGA